MIGDIIVKIIGLIGILMGAGMSYWTYLQNKRFDIFQIYSGKYNSIITSDDIEWWTQVLNDDQVPENKKCEHKMIAYLNLACEEYYLYKTNLIGKKLWNAWKPNIERIISTKFAHCVRDKYQIQIPEELYSEKRQAFKHIGVDRNTM